MDIKNSINRYVNYVLYSFVVLHVFLWTMLPTIFRYNLPMDAIEGAIWGQHFSLGYDKNPFLNGWLTGFALKIYHADGAVYFLGALTVGLSFIALFQLAKKFLSPVYALLSVLLLETISSYNLDAIDFDDNVLELLLWPLIVLFFYRALKQQKIRDWIFVGIFSGLALMTKYYAVVLFVPMALFLFWDETARKSFAHRGIYIAACCTFFICLPHIIWLFSHDFLTMHYAIGRVDDVPISWINHIVFPFKFTMPLLEACLFPLFLLLFFRWPLVSLDWIAEPKPLSSWQWRFLWVIGLGPWAFTILLSLVYGFILNAGWGQPLMMLWTIILVALFQPRITLKQGYRFLGIFLALLIAGSTVYGVSMMHAKDGSSAHYPGRVVSERMTQIWMDHYQTPLSYVVGPRWEAGNVSYYAPNHPDVYMEADSAVSFWIHEDDLKQKGALFVWNNEKNAAFFDTIKKRFPNLVLLPVEHFEWMRAPHSDLNLGVALLPPEKVEITAHR